MRLLYVQRDLLLFRLQIRPGKVLVNALTIQVKSAQIPLSGKATYRGLRQGRRLRQGSLSRCCLRVQVGYAAPQNDQTME